MTKETALVPVEDAPFPTRLTLADLTIDRQIMLGACVHGRTLGYMEFWRERRERLEGLLKEAEGIVFEGSTKDVRAKANEKRIGWLEGRIAFVDKTIMALVASVGVPNMDALLTMQAERGGDIGVPRQPKPTSSMTRPTEDDDAERAAKKRGFKMPPAEPAEPAA